MSDMASFGFSNRIRFIIFRADAAIYLDSLLGIFYLRGRMTAGYHYSNIDEINSSILCCTEASSVTAQFTATWQALLGLIP